MKRAMRERHTAKQDSHQSKGEVKSAMEIALEKAIEQEDEPIEIETEDGAVSMTFNELKEKALQADELANQILYKQAEFENFRKRTAREREDLLKETVHVSDLLEILDHLDRALESEGERNSILEGVRLIRNQLWSLLEKKEVEPVPGIGEPFDPSHHEAIAEHPHESIPKGNVALEYEPGFKIGDKVLRPSKVVVSAGPPRKEE